MFCDGLAKGLQHVPDTRSLSAANLCGVAMEPGASIGPASVACPVSAGKAETKSLFRSLGRSPVVCACPGWGGVSRYGDRAWARLTDDRKFTNTRPLPLWSEKGWALWTEGRAVRPAPQSCVYSFLPRAAAFGGISCPGRVLRSVAVRSALAVPRSGPLGRLTGVFSVHMHHLILQIFYNSGRKRTPLGLFSPGGARSALIPARGRSGSAAGAVPYRPPLFSPVPPAVSNRRQIFCPRF